MFDTMDEKARLRRRLTEDAIGLAMKGRWKEAVAVNQNIIEAVPTDVDAYNRLGKALMELGELAQAKDAYGKALELEPQNSIAKKNLNHLSQLGKVRVKVKKEKPKATPDLFIGEVGKAGTILLSQPAPKEILAKMTAGDQVGLRVKGQILTIENNPGEYLGTVEPPHGLRLAKLMKGGNKYAAAIVSIEDSKVKIIIRETFQHPSQAGRLSFPPKGPDDFQKHVKDILLRRGEEEEITEEEGEVEEADMEEGELLPSGFSIFEAGMYAGEGDEEEDLIEEE